MRLTNVRVDGFRAFGTSVEFDFDADAVVLAGANGRGKTSLLDAIMWCLTGSVPRLGSDRDLVSLHSTNGSCRVAVEVLDDDGQANHIERSVIDGDTTLRIESSPGSLVGARAESRLLDLLSRDGAPVPDFARLSEVFRGSTYLQQDSLREFVESDENKRYEVAGALLGMNALTDLQQALEKERNAWSRQSTADREVLKRSESELQTAREQLNSLSTSSSAVDDIQIRWSGWWERAESFAVSKTQVPADTREAPEALEAALDQLRASTRRLKSRQTALREVASLLASTNPQLDNENAARAITLTANLEQVRERVELSSQRLLAAQEDAEAERARLTRLRDQTEELSALATLALRHLGNQCPVCAQDYDLAGTTERLNRLIAAAQAPQVGAPPRRAVSEASAEVESLRAEEASLAGQLASIEAAVRISLQQKETLMRHLSELDLPSNTTVRSVDAEIDGLESDANASAALVGEGDELLVLIARLRQISRRKDVEDSVLRMEAAISEERERLASRDRAHESSSKLIDAIRRASNDVVGEALRNNAPVWAQVYGRIDPHPTFTAVDITSRTERGKGQLRLSIRDVIASLESHQPSTVLSSSQLNALAVSLFISLNVGFAPLSLRTMMLDDPLSSLDDVNLLGLTDLLRRLKAKRQLVIATHDSQFANLLARKLRPVGEEGATRMFTFESWDRTGPSVRTTDIARVTADLQLVG